MDVYKNDSRLDLTRKAAMDCVGFLALEARKWGLSTGLKSPGDTVPDVLDVIPRVSRIVTTASLSDMSWVRSLIQHWAALTKVWAILSLLDVSALGVDRRREGRMRLVASKKPTTSGRTQQRALLEGLPGLAGTLWTICRSQFPRRRRGLITLNADIDSSSGSYLAV